MLQANFFSFVFRVAGDQHSILPWNRFRFPEYLNPMIDPFFKDIDVFEAIYFHSAKKMTYAFSNTFFWCCFKQSKGWCKWSPVGAAKHTSKNVYHRGQRITFMPTHLTS